MFKLVFGAIWLSFISVFTRIMYSDTGTITVNNQIVSQEEFNAMLWPKIFIGFFWLVGLVIFVIGIIELLRNHKTDKYGETCYGRILNISNTGCYSNDVPELKATICVYVESTGTLEFADEILGIATKVPYSKGDYIEGKFYKGDINITSEISQSEVPSHIASELNGHVESILKQDLDATNVILLNYHNNVTSTNGLSYRYLTALTEKKRGFDTRSCIRVWKELEYINYEDELIKINRNGYLELDSLS